MIRFSASQDPRAAPWRDTASLAYSEQLGKKRQLRPKNGLSANRYAVNKHNNIRAIIQPGSETSATLGEPRRNPGDHGRVARESQRRDHAIARHDRDTTDAARV